MIRYQILFNRSFSASTTSTFSQQLLVNTEESEAFDEKIFSSQQELTLQREYYGYEVQTGVGLVNDLNVKSYLNNPANEQIALEFISYLTASTSLEEFRDIYYDNKKLSDFFNDFYRKIKIYSNQGASQRIVDPTIDLVESKEKIIGRDRVYTKTNSNTSYISKTISANGNVSNSLQANLLPSDTINFSGNDESYYVNIPISRKRIDFYSDDFREYFVDTCDGNITYNRYVYYNTFSLTPYQANIDALIQRQNELNLTTGPDINKINYLKSLLPVNYLDSEGNIRTMPQNTPLTSNQTQATSTQGGLFNISSPQTIIILPQNNQSYSLNNFQDFNEFKTFFNFTYQAWTPSIPGFNDSNKKYIYQQIIDLAMQTNSLFVQQSAGNSGSMSSMQTTMVGPPGMVLCEFTFVPVPNFFSQSYLGQEFDSLVVNQYSIQILHAYPNKVDSVILKYEPFSSATIGPDDNFSLIGFDSNLVNDPYQSEVTINFSQNESVKSVNINIYKNMPERLPMVFSLRPASNPNQVCQYLIVYLELFFNVSKYSFYDEIKVTQSEICNVMYNGFVTKKFNDNFLEIQRPDEFPISFQNSQGFSIQSNFQDINIEDVNNKILNVFYDLNVNFYTISTFLGVPLSGIYNIYTWGSYLFGTEDAFSDVDLIVVADSQFEVRQFKRNGIDMAIYNPTGFQKQIDEFVSKIFNETVLTDRAFTVFNSNEEKYKILERIKFTSNATKQKIKTKASEFRNERWTKSEEAFVRGDFDAYHKRLWSIFRNLNFGIQYLKNGKIDDVRAANSYLDEIKSKNFQTWGQVTTYFYPKIQLLYSELLGL